MRALGSSAATGNMTYFEAVAEDQQEDEKKAEEVGSGTVTIVSTVSDNSKSKPAPKPKFKYPSLLLNTAGNGWFDGTGTSTYYSISDTTRTELFAYTTICGAFSEDLCEENLVDGDYIFRVGGNGDANLDQNTWEFCGVTGSAQTELSFSVKEGKCTAGYLVYSADFISSNGPSVTSSQETESSDVDSTDDDADTPDDVDDDNVLASIQIMSSTAGETHYFSSVPHTMVFLASAIGLAVMAVVAVYMVVISKLNNTTSMAPKVNEENMNDKLLAANGLTIIKEASINPTRHQLVSSLDL